MNVYRSWDVLTHAFLLQESLRQSIQCIVKRVEHRLVSLIIDAKAVHKIT